MKKWNENLILLLNMHGIYPLSEWQHILNKWLRHWVNEVNNNGCHSKLSLESGQIPVVKVFFKDFGRTHFTCRMEYKMNEDKQPVLLVSHTIGFDIDSFIAADCENVDDHYIWVHDELTELDKIVQEGYVLELLNIALSKHLPTVKSE